MFNNLVESGSHADDIARRGSFFLVTLGMYAVLLAATAVVSIYLYDARLGKQNLDIIAMLSPVEFSPAAETQTVAPSPSQNDSVKNLAPMRPILLSSPDNPYNVPASAGTVKSNIPPAPRGSEIGPRVFDPPVIGNPYGKGPGGSVYNHAAGGNTTTQTMTLKEDPPEPPKITPKPPDKDRIISLGVIEGKVIEKPVPPYPAMARNVRASGLVTVQIVVDEKGKVISAQATSGHPLLRSAAVSAAYRALFTPTLLSNQPVKVSGFITYNFILQ